MEIVKKRCGFIMFVIESAAAGCGIPKNQAYGQPRVSGRPSVWSCWSCNQWFLNHFLRRNIYASAHFTKRLPVHAFCCAL